ncbi:MAG TPA: prepilin-type N-terminal cleavage/methylation domain-containing protein [Desulfobacteria bacterium]|nr:prepilin-type N-terminal cleavage/methylation domain-containing protein [Desulfobacteria bacterium]
MLKLAYALRKARKGQKGFTLIELMVVVVIIGILAAVAIPKIAGIVYQSKINADIASGKTLQDAVDRYMQQSNATTTTPSSINDLVPGFINNVPTAQQDQKQVGSSNAIKYDGNTGTVTVYNIQGGTSGPQVWPK